MDTSKLEDLIIELVKNGDAKTIDTTIAILSEVSKLKNGKRQPAGNPNESVASRASSIMEGTPRSYTPRKQHSEEAMAFFDMYNTPSTPSFGHAEPSPDAIPNYTPGKAITTDNVSWQNKANSLL